MSSNVSVSSVQLSELSYQARHCLSQQNFWSPVDGAFLVEKFFWSIVTILEDDEVGHQLLAEINRYVFRPSSFAPQH